jgi:hypothetical protein
MVRDRSIPMLVQKALVGGPMDKTHVSEFINENHVATWLMIWADEPSKQTALYRFSKGEWGTPGLPGYDLYLAEFQHVGTYDEGEVFDVLYPHRGEILLLPETSGTKRGRR